MKKIYACIATTAICMCLAIGASGQKGPAPTGCGSDVTNLSLFVENIGGNIVSDNNTPYTTKKVKGDQITAMFQINNCSQDFTLNLNFSSRYLAVNFPNGGGTYQGKFYNFDRVASVPPTPSATTASDPFFSSPFCLNGADPAPNGFVVTTNTDGTYRDNYAGCGIDGIGNAYVRRSVGSDLKDLSSSADYRLRFQKSPIDGGISDAVVAGTTYIKVYHPNATTWILEPEAIDNPAAPGTKYSPGAKLEYLNGYINRGNYDMPFRFTLTKL